MNNTIIIPNIQKYTQQIPNENLILKRITGSKILECKINNVSNDIKKYIKLLVFLYSTTDRVTILQKSTLNISEEERYDKGFKYYKNLGVSIQYANARKILKEIINIIKIKNYNMELKIKHKNDEVENLILRRKTRFVDEATLFKKNLRRSKILECKINNVSNDIKKYIKLLVFLYSTIDRVTILQKSTLNISEEERYDKGFKYYKNLGVSIQYANARKILKEIINIIKIKNYNMELKIKLENNEVICFVI